MRTGQARPQSRQLIDNTHTHTQNQMSKKFTCKLVKYLQN